MPIVDHSHSRKQHALPRTAILTSFCDQHPRGFLVMLRRAFIFLAIAGAAFASLGCGYTTNGMYSTCFHTINVPIFKNDTMRRDIEFILTEKVIQKIETRTPYKVIAGEKADTELRGTITSFNKAHFGEDGFDNPRGGNMLLVLNLSWIDNRTGKVIHQSSQRFDLRGQQPFVIDLAQSSATATDDLADKISNHVVSLLQEPW